MPNINPLVLWFDSSKRALPWRQFPTPYEVWVSEVMLQQTQVAVVIPYYLQWMELFPTIKALANAPLEQVIKTWEGLGYYSRARNLHHGAKTVLEKYQGELPNSRDELLSIKGLGDYTVGAILSFAFKQKAPAIDGNVQRVITRVFGLEEDIVKSTTKKKILSHVEQLLPEHEPWVVSEALIELGALICTKKPACMQCPLKNQCQAFLQGKTAQIPFKSTKQKTEKIHRTVALIQGQGFYLIRKVPPGEIMEGLYEFPYFEGNSTPVSAAEQITLRYGLNVTFLEMKARVQHGFTRFQATLEPMLFETCATKPVAGFEWVKEEALLGLPFSSGHRKLAQALVTT